MHVLPEENLEQNQHVLLRSCCAIFDMARETVDGRVACLRECILTYIGRRKPQPDAHTGRWMIVQRADSRAKSSVQLDAKIPTR
jgi:hypothetical protein